MLWRPEIEGTARARPVPTGEQHGVARKTRGIVRSIVARMEADEVVATLQEVLAAERDARCLGGVRASGRAIRSVPHYERLRWAGSLVVHSSDKMWPAIRKHAISDAKMEPI